MALKLKKYPKKPKASASASTLQNYLDRCKAVDKANAAKKQEHAKKLTLRKKVQSIGKK